MTVFNDWTKRAGSGDSHEILLVEIELTEPSPRTIRLSFQDTGPDGIGYAGLIEDADPIEEPGQFVASSYIPCSWGFTVLDEWAPGQAAGDTFASLLSAYRFRGAAITVKQWDRELDASTFGVMFVGIINGYSTARNRITFDCVQRRDWNRTMDLYRVRSRDFPRAPQNAIGKLVPVLLGRGAGQPLRGAFNRAFGSSRNNFDHHGGGVPTARGILVDYGRGNTTAAGFEKGTVLVSANELSDIGDGQVATNFFGANNGTLPSVVNPDGGDIFNGPGGAGFKVANAAGVHFIPVIPTDVVEVSDMANNPRGVLDPTDETSYARLNYDDGERNLVVTLPNVPPAGKFVDLWILFGYKSNPSVGTLKFVFEKSPGNEQSWSPLTSSTIIEAFQVDPSYWPTNNPWDLQNSRLRLEFQGAAAGIAIQCFCLGVIIQYQPTVRYIRNGVPHEPVPTGFRTGFEPVHERIYTKEPVGFEKPIDDVESEYFCNANGPPDDGSGTFTGVPDELIERAPDLANYLLQTYCGQSPGQIETGNGKLGSFVDARAKLVTWNQRKMTHFLNVDTEVPARDLLEQLARDSVSAFHLGRTDGKARWTVFERNPSVNFRTIHPEDVADLSLVTFRTSVDTSLMSSIRISYLYDTYRGAFTSEAFCSSEHSAAGYAYEGVRDQAIVVVANESDRFDFSSTAGTGAASLTPGTYEPWDFAKHLAAQMNAVSADDFIVNYGPRVETGYNDRIDINDGSVKVATIPQASYATFEALCTAVAAALNLVSSNWTCTYSRTTRKVTLDRTSGTKTLLGHGGANANRSALGLLGLSNDNAAAPRTGESEVEEERFNVSDGTGQALNLPFETGANGANAATPRTCGALLGFPIDRNVSLNDSNYTGVAPMGTREAVLLAAEKYGATRPYTASARTILDTDTAREVRDRLIDLAATPRPTVSFRSFRIRDLERYHVLQFSDRFDGLLKYPEEGTDGSWAGKKFWVANCRHFVGPNRWDSEAFLVRA